MGKIAIIGLGLIGGSMGLALKRAGPVDTEVVGFDIDPQVGGRALKAGAVKKLAPTLEAAVADATLVVVAVPVISIQKVFETIGPRLQRGAVVTDTASTKTDVLRWARDHPPQAVHFVGGHPMAGKEKSGPQAAEDVLFVDRPYAVVPPLDAWPGAVSAVVGFANALGARPLFMDAAEHDAYAAAISHVPLVASLGLFNLARGSAAWPELANMAGPSFYDLTRLASGNPEMAHDVFLTNKQNIVHWINRYITELLRIEELIEGDDPEALFRTLAETQIERETFLSSPPKREDPGLPSDLPSPSQSFVNLLAGGMWTERAKEMNAALEEQARQRQREDRLRRRE